MTIQGTKNTATHIAAPGYMTPMIAEKNPKLVALQSIRTGGVSHDRYNSLNLGNNTGDSAENVQENLIRLCQTVNIDHKRLVSSEQVHGTNILVAETPGRYHGYDAFITNKKNIFLCIFTADCYPILIYDPQHRAVGAVHAGWKGTAGNIVMKTVKAMLQQFHSRPEECFAYIGTGISCEAYEVDRAVAEKFPSNCRYPSACGGSNEKYLLDLSLINNQQLSASGIPEPHIEQSPYCTYRDSTMFFSYRRDNGITGRMVSLIGIR